MACLQWLVNRVRPPKKVQRTPSLSIIDTSSSTSVPTIALNESVVIPNNNVKKTEIVSNGHLKVGDDKGLLSPPQMMERNKSSSKLNQDVLLAGAVGTCMGSAQGTRVMASLMDDNNAIDDDIFKNFDFPFTNLVFEGGGNKGMAYVGALQVLEEAGITQRVKRVAGSSVGAIAACLFAVGYTPMELKEFMEADLKNVLVDHRCGYCSLLPNLLNGFGWNPGKKLFSWFGEHLREQTGDADITFRQVYDKYGRELCIVVTNLSQMSTEYFHPKTTPNTPIRTAVRMSTALPGVFQSVKYRMNDENTDIYVDGGLLCNYPIHAFDGWWLSMTPEDSFFLKLQPLEDYARLFSKSERFGKWNASTIGIMLYSHTETELMKDKLAERLAGTGPQPPNRSKLYRKRRKVRIGQQAASIEHKAVVSAVGRFMKELHRLHYDLDGTISLKELKKVYGRSTSFTVEDQLLLFGAADINEAFSELDNNSDGEITFQELMSFVEKKGVNIQTRFLGYTRREIKSLGDFISTLQTALSINVKKNYVEDQDIERTIGIDTDYIEANDFYLEEMDKKFLLDSGAAAARAFLRHYCTRNADKRRRESALLSRDFFSMQRKPYQIEVTSDEPDERQNTHADTELLVFSAPSSLRPDTRRSGMGNSQSTLPSCEVIVHEDPLEAVRSEQPPRVSSSDIGEDRDSDSDVSLISLATTPTLR